MTRGSTLLLGMLCQFIFVVSAMAHNEWGVIRVRLVPEAVVTREQQAALANRQEDDDARWIVENALLWEPGSTLKGCFIGGSVQQRNSVVVASRKLLSEGNANIDIDFDDGQTSKDCAKDINDLYQEDIRVSFAEGCCAAYVGRASKNKKAAEGPSVWLAGTPSQSTIQHELLHVLGFHHEHQKPGAPCKFDFSAIKARYPEFSDKQIQENFSELDDNSYKFSWSNTFDPDSLLKYYFYPNVLVGGTSSPCYSKQNERASSEDIFGLNLMYPHSNERRTRARKIKLKRGSIDFGSNGSPALEEAISTMPLD